MNQNFENVKQTVIPILQANGVEFAGVFGSVARGEETPESDVDILVKFAGVPTFSAYLRLDESLKKGLNRNIDLVTVGAVNKFLRPHIEKDLKILYGQRPNLLGRN